MNPESVTAQEAFTRWLILTGGLIGVCVLLAFIVALLFAIGRSRRRE